MLFNKYKTGQIFQHKTLNHRILIVAAYRWIDGLGVSYAELNADGNVLVENARVLVRFVDREKLEEFFSYYTLVSDLVAP